MESNREKKVSKRKTICLTPKPVKANSIKTKVQHKYILKHKERPDEGNTPAQYHLPNSSHASHIESLPKTDKKVQIVQGEVSHDKIPDVLSDKIDLTGMQMRKKLADVEFTTNINHYMTGNHGSEKLSGDAMDDEVTKALSELSTIDPDLDFNKFIKNECLDENEGKNGKADFIYTLSTLEATAVLTVFDKAIDQLTILKHLLPHNPTKAKTKYRSLEERFGKKKTSSKEMNQYKLDCSEPHPADLSLMRLQQERAFLQDTLCRTARSLAKTNSFWPIKSIVEDLRVMAKENLVMAWKWPVTSYRMREARNVLKQSELAMSVLPINHRIEMQEMQEGMSHTVMKLQLREKYIDRWEAARRSQHRIILNRGENKLRKKIMDIGARTVHEIRVGEEVDRYVEFEEKRVLSLLAAWEKRHEEELEKIGVATMSSRLTLDVAQYHTQTALEEYESRQGDIHRWITRRENQAKRVEAALRIQVWWRTILYRRRLMDAYNVIKTRHLEATQFGKKIIRTAVAMKLIDTPVLAHVEVKKERKGKNPEKEEGIQDKDLYAITILRNLKVPERLALARKSVVREQLAKTKKLLVLQSLWGRAEKKRRLMHEAERRAVVVERRRRIRQAAKQGRGATYEEFEEFDRDKLSGGSDELPRSSSRLMRRQASRPRLPGITPRFSTPLTDLLARASFAAKLKRMRSSEASEEEMYASLTKLQLESIYGYGYEGSVDRKSYDELIDYLKDRDV